MKIGMVAGEVSGDLLGGGLLRALQSMLPSTPIECYGIGGEEMTRCGFQSLYDMERLSVMGFIEPLFRLRELLKMRRHLIHYFTEENRPDVFIGIDAPGFNLGLEVALRKAGIRVIHYVSPSVWAWGKKRLNKIAKGVDLMLTLFPFEADFYQNHTIPVKFVGHPLADEIPYECDKTSSRATLGLNEKECYIALLPGSRINEIKLLAPVFIEAAKRCWLKKPQVRFITSAVNSARNIEFQFYVKSIAPDLPITFFEGKSLDVLAAADLVLVTSGTATLEAMLFKKPMVIAYRMAAFTYQIARFLVNIPFIGLPNLLANQLLVPEFIQDKATPENIAEALLNYLDDPQKMITLEKTFLDIHKILRQDANNQAALAVKEFMHA